jgi:hypothetical protein
MRDTINVFYYPDGFLSPTTLKKAILLFDELHFMDRPAFTFRSFGSIGVASPLRRVEAKFRGDGVPLFVHDAPDGPVADELFDEIKIDIDDPLFLKRFQDGIKNSPTFRQLQIAPGNYGAFGNEQNVAEKLVGVDLLKDLKGYGRASDLFSDDGIGVFELGTPLGCTKQLVVAAALCSTKLNFALTVSAKQGFLPLADAGPFGDLLGAKYARAVKRLDPVKNRIQATDLTFAIFDELISPERLEKLEFDQIIQYRRASQSARETFLEYLSALQAKQADIVVDSDYAGAIRKIVTTEIIPAAKDFKNKLDTIGDAMFGAMVKGAAAGAAAFIGSSMSVFGDLSWNNILTFAAAGAAYMVTTSVDTLLADRAARRECSISYILSLDDLL